VRNVVCALQQIVHFGLRERGLRLVFAPCARERASALLQDVVRECIRSVMCSTYYKYGDDAASKTLRDSCTALLCGCSKAQLPGDLVTMRVLPHVFFGALDSDVYASLVVCHAGESIYSSIDR
jgi:hypothetical protein